ncbi:MULTISPECIES: adenosylhomocysteinase [Ferrimicrobium]|jgi:adenosylhomocysteinase|uniref:Adenosylhomocysteinase n=1 Tax=Ferrimicrobium acidiphilum TaxID=121039 RepID=A0ABV3Y1E5_9ACTN|nr:adenosylhomocysteinase [Ferrimicrobium sp.]MCL5973869.1 adenosylhomocysteinase [Actinomycetota bacterium]
MEYDISDIGEADAGRQRIMWADAQMPVLTSIRERFARTKPLAGVTIAACLHITTETANLLRTLQAGGAQVVAAASNPLSTQDDVAASLVKHDGIAVFARRGEDTATYYAHIDAVLDAKPQVTMDDGCDLVSRVHRERPEQVNSLFAGTEETTTGVIRLRAMEQAGSLGYPIVAVNDANTKHMFDNRYGTGQSTLDGVIRATNILLAGKVIVVAGYGYCGKGVASRARGLGAQVIVTEIQPLPALEAVMDGFAVMSMEQAARVGDIFITVTGNRDVLRPEHFRVMKDGAVLANSGHFDVEIDLAGLEQMTTGERRRMVRPMVEEFLVRGDDGKDRRVQVIAQGRLVNLSAAEGHPASVMDMSFANQALSVEWLVARRGELSPQVYDVPSDIDASVAELKLATMQVVIDELTPAQREYLASWTDGTK